MSDPRINSHMDECPECGSYVHGVSRGPPWFEGWIFSCEGGHELVVKIDEDPDAEYGGWASLVLQQEGS